MCGVTGFLQKPSFNELLRTTVHDMVDQLGHRGPDDHGVWVDSDAGIALGHSRLSIVDVSQEGHQPMMSASGRYIISYNGEVYNFIELRGELDRYGHQFRGNSDTEVMLAAVEQWGLNAALDRFVGMFAIALWDRKQRTLSLVRDRLGIKPMYYGWSHGNFIFGSELKAIKRHPDFDAEIDRNALTMFFRHNYVPSPWCIYQGFHKLPPASILTVDSPESNPSPVEYWNFKTVAEEGSQNNFIGSDEDAVDELDRILQQSVKDHMVSDVPIGAFLSGGIDSSTVVGLMQRHSTNAVKTFSIGFAEESHNEAEQAKKVAHHLGTDHTELYVTSQDCMNVIDKLPAMYDEPFADSSQVPTYLVSKLASERVKVSLSGDGGDELFCGYNRYFSADNLWKETHRVPAALQSLVIRASNSALAKEHGIWLDRLGRFMPGRLKTPNMSHKLRRMGHYLSLDNPESMYPELVSFWNEAQGKLVVGGREPNRVLTQPTRWAKLEDFKHRMMFIDTLTYLPDDILTKVDRASMAVSLETRVPLLDHRVVEFAWRLPLASKVRSDESKWILRQVLKRYVPSKLWDRPKTGFGIPIGLWLQGQLREWAEELLSEDRLRREGYLHAEPIRRKWEQHISSGNGLGYDLWGVLMFQAWKEAQDDPSLQRTC